MGEGIEVTKTESKAIAMLMVYEDGTTEVYKKGFIVTNAEEENDQMSVTMIGCNISGQELIDIAVTALVPIADRALNNEEEEGES